MARQTNLFARGTSTASAARPGQDNPDSGIPVYNSYKDAHLAGVKRRVANIAWAGSMGYAPDYSRWVHEHPHVYRNLVCMLIEPPRMMKAMPNANQWIGMLKAMVETMPKSVTGLNAELKLSTAQINIGGAGQVLEVATNLKEEPPAIQMAYDDRVGIPLYRYISAWQRYFIMDQHTKTATINTIPNASVSDGLADQYSMTMLFYEPDEVNRLVTQAFLVTNMFPKGTGANSPKRDLVNDMELRDVTIDFAGICVYNAGVDEFAQFIMDELMLIGADPHARAAFVKDIAGHVRDVASMGYQKSVDDIAPQNRIFTQGERDNAVSQLNRVQQARKGRTTGETQTTSDDVAGP